MYATLDDLIFINKPTDAINLNLFLAGKSQIKRINHKIINRLINNDFIIETDLRGLMKVYKSNSSTITLLKKEYAIPYPMNTFLFANPDITYKELIRKTRENIASRILPNDATETDIIKESKNENIIDLTNVYLNSLFKYNSLKVYSKNVLRLINMKSYTIKEAILSNYTPEKAYKTALKLNNKNVFIEDKAKDNYKLLFKIKDFSKQYKLESLIEIEEGLSLAAHPKKSKEITIEKLYNYIINARYPSRKIKNKSYSLIIYNIPIIYLNQSNINNKVIETTYWTKMYSESTDHPFTTHLKQRFQIRRKSNYKIPHFLNYGEVACFYILARRLWKNKDKKIIESPFPIPKPEFSNFLNYLRYSTLIEENNPMKKNKISIRLLNKTEMEYIAMEYLINNPNQIFTKLDQADKPVKDYIITIIKDDY